MTALIRIATEADLAAVTAIYNHYIEQTPATFDVLPFTADSRKQWFETFADTTRHQLLVLEIDGKVSGYASSSPLRPKPAYDTSVETTIYLAPALQGQGHGRTLFSSLIERLQQVEDPVHRCYGIVTQPNEASMALHRHLGFRQVAHLHEVGFKFDQYWDTVWMELRL